MKPITYIEAFQLLETGARMGSFPSFAYVLGAHVLHRMYGAETRQIMLTLRDTCGKVLVGKDGRFIAGQVDSLVHEGMGTPVGDPRFHISAHYVDALQKLHWGGILYSDIQESRLDEEGMESTHFTMRPELREGIHWTERTPIVYRLPETSVDKVFEVVAGIQSLPIKSYETVQFL